MQYQAVQIKSNETEIKSYRSYMQSFPLLKYTSVIIPDTEGLGINED